MLRISKGMVSISRTGLVIYNSLGVLTLRLGSSDNPAKMEVQVRGRRAGRGPRPRWPGSRGSRSVVHQHIPVRRPPDFPVTEREQAKVGGGGHSSKLMR